MLSLNEAQLAALEGLKFRRDLQRLGEVLAEAFPELPARLGERYPRLIEHGVQRARIHGLDHAVGVGRYLACCCAFGADFDSRPEQAWARPVLAAVESAPGLRIFQLGRRATEALRRMAAEGRVAAGLPASFEQALPRLDRALMPLGRIGRLLPPEWLQLGEPCDLAHVDLLPLAPVAWQHYRYEAGQWRRLPQPVQPSALRLPVPLAPDGPPGSAAREPQRVYTLAPGGEGVLRLQVRTELAACCDPEVHPRLSLQHAAGLRDWRGRHAHAVSLELAAPAAVDWPAPGKGLAAEGGVDWSRIAVETCGLRSADAPIGDLGLDLGLLPATQWMMAWRREPGPSWSWPHRDPLPLPPPPRLHLERDGQAQAARLWQEGLQALDVQLATGLDRLAEAWAAVAGLEDARVEAEPRLLAGHAGLSWGWMADVRGALHPPVYRVVGQMELQACDLQLRLSGRLHSGAAISLLRLDCAGSVALRSLWGRERTGEDLLAALAPTQLAVGLPWVAELIPVARPEAGRLEAMAPVQGSLSLACGLRAHPGGVGLQWFARLELEPLRLVVEQSAPGGLTVCRTLELLPAMKLLDWSLG